MPDLHASLKKAWLQEALYSILPKEMPFDVVSAEQIFEWRRKITLHARWDTGFVGCGFIAQDNVSLIPISWCPLFFSDKESPFLAALHSILKKIPGTPSTKVDLTLFRLPEGLFSLSIYGNIPLPSHVQASLIHNLSHISSLQTFSLRFHNVRYDEGPRDFTFQAMGTTWHFSIDAFIQNHSTLSELLWNDVISIVHKDGPGKTILDLYSGIGVTAISLARRGHTVTAVELSKAAVQAARKSAYGTEEKEAFCGSHKGRLELLHCSVEEFLPILKETGDWWIVNPPRTGLSKEVSAHILRKRPAKILYVSCSPSTLARDLFLFSKAGWRLTWLKGYDMFPQTTHFETVAVIEL
jgi:tRNA/tmRNA/rRNA uracil-C5-methylase (TrmA/RlmC/RlmD family)